MGQQIAPHPQFKGLKELYKNIMEMIVQMRKT